MHKFINNHIFSDLIKIFGHKGLTNFCSHDFYLKGYYLNSTRYSTSIREPSQLWNDVILKKETDNKGKSKLIEIENKNDCNKIKQNYNLVGA